MAEVYLVSQLPSLDCLGDNSPLPITEERFIELCNSFLGKKPLSIIQSLTINPPRVLENTGSKLVNAWYEGERNLRIALARARAEKSKKQFDDMGIIVPVEHTKAAAIAVDMDNPLEAEKFLNGYRLRLLDALRPMDNFSEEFVYYYGLKLKLIIRIRQFDCNAGKNMYDEIYDSILSGNRTEVIQ